MNPDIFLNNAALAVQLTLGRSKFEFELDLPSLHRPAR